MATQFRADHVGSFLRPQEVKDARDAYRAGSITEEALRAIENEHILRVIELQKQSGIGIYSDGELRRSGWAGGFGESVEGYIEGAPPSACPSRAAAATGADGDRHHPGQPHRRAGRRRWRPRHRREADAGAAAHGTRVGLHQGERAGAVQGDDARRQLRDRARLQARRDGPGVRLPRRRAGRRRRDHSRRGRGPHRRGLPLRADRQPPLPGLHPGRAARPVGGPRR